LAIHGRQPHDDDDFHDFWVETLDEDSPDPISDKDFARGFVDGALEVWNAVKSRLEPTPTV
jgi:hypothetical protein